MCVISYMTNVNVQNMLRQIKKEFMIIEAGLSHIGQTAEVRFFEYTDGGIPRFPVCVGFRLDK